jgi:phage terminase Nu1 subunit (DNA packaging protein)
MPSDDYTSVLDADYFTKKQFATVIKKNMRTIDRMILQGCAPPITRIGRTAFFRRDAVRQWLLERETPVRPNRKPRRGGAR